MRRIFGIYDLCDISEIEPMTFHTVKRTCKYYKVRFCKPLKDSELEVLTQYNIPLYKVGDTFELIFRTPTNRKNFINDCVFEVAVLLNITLIVDKPGDVPRMCGWEGCQKPHIAKSF